MRTVYAPLVVAEVLAFWLAAAVLGSWARLARLAREPRQLARADELTGLENLWQFKLDALALNPRDHLLALDLDGFKALNDRRGHAVGDRALALVARALAASLRPADRAYRLGGQEFAVLLRDCGPLEARAAAERLRLAVAAADPDLGLTVSGGLVGPRGKPDGRAALEAADRLPYRAKAEGRDRVLAEPDPLATGAGMPAVA